MTTPNTIHRVGGSCNRRPAVTMAATNAALIAQPCHAHGVHPHPATLLGPNQGSFVTRNGILLIRITYPTDSFVPGTENRLFYESPVG